VTGPERVCLCFLTSGPHLNLQNDHRIPCPRQRPYIRA
jgi:hypothetical protein